VPERVPRYRPIAEHLPAVYQTDADSWEQVRGYTGLVDDLGRAALAGLEDLPLWLSPDARELHPPGLPAGASADEVYARYLALADELADWFGFEYPETWSVPSDRERELDRKLEFCRRAARFWRRRGTPRGFYAWLCYWFELVDRVDRPAMIEHYAIRANASDPDEGARRVTLLVPRGTAFARYERRRELVRFVDRHAPAHLVFQICWIHPADLANLYPAPTDSAATKRTKLRALVDTVGDFTPEADGIHLELSPFPNRPLDRLGHGTLPGTAERDS
jgi:hypothetical protein